MACSSGAVPPSYSVRPSRHCRARGTPLSPPLDRVDVIVLFRTTTANILTTLSRAYDELRNRRGTRGLEHGGEL